MRLLRIVEREPGKTFPIHPHDCSLSTRDAKAMAIAWIQAIPDDAVIESLSMTDFVDGDRNDSGDLTINWHDRV